MSFYESSAGDTDFRRKFTASEKKPEPTVKKPNEPKKSLIEERSQGVDLKKNLYKTQIVESVRHAGYSCQVCNMTFKDSNHYLDHINSAQHLMAAGLGLTIEPATIDQVRERISFWAQKTDEKAAEYDLKARVETILLQEKEATKKRRLEQKERKKAEKEAERAALAEFQDEQVAEMMGFGSFKTSK